jgi:hypothetical protein
MFIPAITMQACRARDRTGDQDHLSSQTPSWAGQVSPQLPAMITDWPPRIEYARAMPAGRSGQRIKIQDHHVTMILIYPATSITTRRGVKSAVSLCDSKYHSLLAHLMVVTAKSLASA